MSNIATNRLRKSETYLMETALARDPLVVMGNGNLTTEVWITAERVWKEGEGWTNNWEWTVTITYIVNDWFKDPLNWDDKPGQKEVEWVNCTIYPITGNWVWKRSGIIEVIADEHPADHPIY